MPFPSVPGRAIPGQFTPGAPLPAPVTSTGSLALAPMAMSGTAAVPVNVTSTGSVALAPMKLAGTGAGGNTTASGSVALAPMALAGTGGQAFASTGTLALAPMRLSGAGAGGNTTTAGSVALAPMALAGTGASILPGPLVSPGWQAARAGLPGDASAVSKSSQIGQLLAAHGITPLYAGAPLIAAGGNTAGTSWISLAAFDVDQPFTMPAGKTTLGRVTLPVSPVGNGADITVGLYTDSAGVPGSLITSTRVPAAWLTQLAAPAGLPAGGPLATAASSTVIAGPVTTATWTQPAVSANGSGTYATPVTSGYYTILLGGYDAAAAASAATVSTISYLGGGTVSGPTPQPSLPQGAWYGMAAATSSAVVFAGGVATGGATYLSSVWTASWDPSTGTVGAWTAQQALPNATVQGGMAAYGDYVYVLGGNTANTNATSVDHVWIASAVNGQIQSWAAGPFLPQAINAPIVAAVNGWLIAAGGVNSAGTVQTAVWYARIRPDGTLGGWLPGPALPIQGFSFSPSWNLAVTDSAMVIVSGSETSGSPSIYMQALTVTADGPAAAWMVQLAHSSGEYQVTAYPSGSPGQWEIFDLHLASYDAILLAPLPQPSIPLPATGLTAGATYHLVIHQNGGDLNDYTQIATTGQAFTAAAQTRPAGGGSWTALSGTYGLPATIWDQTPAGRTLHTWEDSGARITSLIQASASGQLLGVCEATAFADGTMLPAVTEVTYSGAVPVGTSQLA